MKAMWPMIVHTAVFNFVGKLSAKSMSVNAFASSTMSVSGCFNIRSLYRPKEKKKTETRNTEMTAGSQSHT